MYELFSVPLALVLSVSSGYPLGDKYENNGLWVQASRLGCRKTCFMILQHSGRCHDGKLFPQDFTPLCLPNALPTLVRGRFHLYFVILLVAIFCFDLYLWRGRAFVLAVREAARCRQTRVVLSRTASDDDADDAETAQKLLSPEGGDVEVGTSSPRAASTSEVPLFAPLGTTPATDAPQVSARHRRGAPAAHKARSQSVDATASSDPSEARKQVLQKKKVRFASFGGAATGPWSDDESRPTDETPVRSEEGPGVSGGKAPAWGSRGGGGVTPKSRAINSSPVRGGFRSIRVKEGRRWSGAASFGAKPIVLFPDAPTANYGSTASTTAVAKPLPEEADGAHRDGGGGSGGDGKEGDESVRARRRVWQAKTNDDGTSAGEDDGASNGGAFLGRDLKEDQGPSDESGGGWRDSFSKWYKR